MTSTFSLVLLPSWLTTAWILLPFGPIQAPLGSTLGSLVVTLTLALTPGILAIPTISTVPS